MDEVNGEQLLRIKKSLKRLFFTEGKVRLLAMDDDRATPYPVVGKFKIYNFALESSNDNTNYGVYANGLLVESSFKYWIERRMMNPAIVNSSETVSVSSEISCGDGR